uniref:Uncharacterized protein n=1 Tax=Utricularia reniformis TaxID=192314 RepID=A0A1Y0B4Q8_9LAMI|nr:hypothetical protein AEK19_MT2233 [Utricularia reniformis]ART32378.1 hypothetical protein AEK19_MT2233 [Utricularia reniformis]
MSYFLSVGVLVSCSLVVRGSRVVQLVGANVLFFLYLCIFCFAVFFPLLKVAWLDRNGRGLM